MNDELIHFEAEFAEGDEVTGEIGGVPYIERTAILFEGGTQKGIDYTDGDIAAIARNFAPPPDEKRWRVPLQLGHTKSARDTIGSVRKVWAAGKQLLGTLRYVGQEAIEKARSGVWGRLSSGIEPTNKRLHHVAVLPFPHVVTAEVFEQGGNPVSETQKTQETPAPAAAVVDYEAKMAAMTQEFEAKMAARDKQYNDRIQTLEQTTAKQAEVIRFGQIQDKVEEFCEAGKVLPVGAPKLVEFLKGLSDEQIAQYEAYLNEQPALVQFGAMGSTSSKRPGGPCEADEDKKADELAKKYGPKK